MSWVEAAKKAYEATLEEAEEKERADRPSLEREEREALEFFDARTKEIYDSLDEIVHELNQCGYVASLEVGWKAAPLLTVPVGMRLHSTTHTKEVAREDRLAYRCLSFTADSVIVRVTVYLDGVNNHHLVMEIGDTFFKKTSLLVDDPDKLDKDELARVFVHVREVIAIRIKSGRYTAGSIM